MTLDEAKMVAAICSTADGGCSVCVKKLVEELQEAFSEFEWHFDDEDTFIFVTKRTVD